MGLEKFSSVLLNKLKYFSCLFGDTVNLILGSWPVTQWDSGNKKVLETCFAVAINYTVGSQIQRDHWSRHQAKARNCSAESLTQIRA